MTTVLKILAIIFVLWMLIGVYLVNIQHPKAQVVMGLGVFFMAFILMPAFIYHRYKDGKYKKYIMNQEDKKKTE